MILKAKNNHNIIQNICILLVLFLFLSSAKTTHAKEHIIDIPEKSKVFIPEKITITQGDSIRWLNNDTSIPVHMFASVPGSYSTQNPEIDIITIKPNDSWEHTFNKPGRYPYFCFIHRGMTGEVIVKEKKSN